MAANNIELSACIQSPCTACSAKGCPTLKVMSWQRAVKEGNGCTLRSNSWKRSLSSCSESSLIWLALAFLASICANTEHTAYEQKQPLAASSKYRTGKVYVLLAATCQHSVLKAHDKVCFGVWNRVQTQAYISLDSRFHTSRLSEPCIALRIQDVLGIYLLHCASAFIGLLMPLLSQSPVTSIQLDSSLQATDATEPSHQG